jgi:hypothetical protein
VGPAPVVSTTVAWADLGVLGAVAAVASVPELLLAFAPLPVTLLLVVDEAGAGDADSTRGPSLARAGGSLLTPVLVPVDSRSGAAPCAVATTDSCVAPGADGSVADARAGSP